jgi:hypothetical protein
MTKRRLSPAEVDRRLARLGRDYEALKVRVQDVGFICEGSLVERYMSCGKPNCRCVDPDERHGPYFQLSWKEAGRTVSRRLSANDAVRYREWIANRRKLDAVLKQMRELSRQAGQYLLEGTNGSTPTTQTQTPRQRSDR